MTANDLPSGSPSKAGPDPTVLAALEKLKRLVRRVTTIALFANFLCVTPLALSQEVTASITGTVLDPTGASVVGAAVTAKDTERGTTHTVQTNSVGVFNLPRMPVGIYELRVEARGFQTAVYRAVVLVLNQTAGVDFQLKIGQAAETMEVTSAAPLLHTDATLLSTRQIHPRKGFGQARKCCPPRAGRVSGCPVSWQDH